MRRAAASGAETNENVSLCCPLTGTEHTEKSRLEAGSFSFDRKSTRVSEKHFDAAYIIVIYNRIVNGHALLQQRTRARHRK